MGTRSLPKLLVRLQVRTFLLEKSRVTNASLAKERSYHIFYQILAGSQTAGRGLSELMGKHPDDFYYTSLSGTNYVPQIDGARSCCHARSFCHTCGVAITAAYRHGCMLISMQKNRLL